METPRKPLNKYSCSVPHYLSDIRNIYIKADRFPLMMLTAANKKRKVLDQWKPNLVWIITRVSSFKIVSGDAVHQPTWPLLLKIEHMVKLQVFGNNSKTINNIKNLTWGKNDQHIKIYLPCNFEVNLITHLGVIALFSSNL